MLTRAPNRAGLNGMACELVPFMAKIFASQSASAMHGGTISTGPSCDRVNSLTPPQVECLSALATFDGRRPHIAQPSCIGGGGSAGGGCGGCGGCGCSGSRGSCGGGCCFAGGSSYGGIGFSSGSGGSLSCSGGNCSGGCCANSGYSCSSGGEWRGSGNFCGRSSVPTQQLPTSAPFDDIEELSN
eukprot:6180288-Pleurochrysis_carterae.AAC.2